MAVAQRPMTPLPWRYCRLALGSFTYEPCIASESGEGRFGRVTEQVWREDDAAYIAHVANAYPKLVEALRVATEYAALNTAGGARGFPKWALDANGDPSADLIVAFCQQVLNTIGEGR